MAISKVIYTDENGISSTWMDVTGDTVTSANLLSPNTATKNDGTSVTGSILTKTGTDLSASGDTVTVPAGYYASNASKSVASGSATTPATSITANPTISVNSSTGVITATTSASQSVTPTVSAGYVSSGTAGTVSVSGSATESLTTQAAQTIYPSASDQTITGSKYLTGTQTIKGVLLTNLTADNIKKDVVVKVGDSADDDRITSVTGTYEGGGGGGGVEEIEEGVQFIDYDGTLVETWATSTVASKTALPSNPSHTGLTAQGWNWSLSDIKTYIASHPDIVLTVGQMYVTTSGKTEIDIELRNPDLLAPYLKFAVNGTAVVDWGDGSATSTVTGSSLSTSTYTQHTYSAVGNYTISIQITSDSFRFYNNYVLVIASGSTTGPSRRYNNSVVAVRLGSNITSIGSSAFYFAEFLRYITMPNTITEIQGNAFQNCNLLESLTVPSTVTTLGANAVYCCYSLKTVAIPNGITTISGSLFSTCYSLRSAIIPNGITAMGNNNYNYCHTLRTAALPSNISTLGGSTFYSCYNLASITIPSSVTTIGNSVFYSCYNLQKLTIPSGVTSIGTQSIYSCYSLCELHFKPTSPPTVSNSNTFQNLPTDCKIYVPTGYLSAYTTASNYPSSVTYTYVEE